MRSALRLVFLRLCVVEACGGCTPGATEAHISLTSTSGKLYVEFDHIGSGSCAVQSSSAAIADFGAKTLTATEVTAHGMAKNEPLSQINFGTPDPLPVLDADQTAGAVKIGGVSFQLPNLTETWSSCRGYVWTYWYSAKLGRYYFVYPKSCSGRYYAVCTESAVCTAHTPPEEFYTFAMDDAPNYVYDQLNLLELREGTNACSKMHYYNFDENGDVTTIPALNQEYQSKLRPPSVYDPSDGNVYMWDVIYSATGDAGAQITRYNIASKETTVVKFTQAQVDEVAGGGGSTVVLIIIIVAAVVVVLALAGVFVMRKKSKTASSARG